MKTPQDWSHIHGAIDAYQNKQEALVQFISAIQQDAFDSGRVEGLRQAKKQLSVLDLGLEVPDLPATPCGIGHTVEHDYISQKPLDKFHVEPPPATKSDAE